MLENHCPGGKALRLEQGLEVKTGGEGCRQGKRGKGQAEYRQISGHSETFSPSEMGSHGRFPGTEATRPDLYFKRFPLAIMLSGNTTLFASGEYSLNFKFYFVQGRAAKC